MTDSQVTAVTAEQQTTKEMTRLALVKLATRKQQPTLPSTDTGRTAAVVAALQSLLSRANSANASAAAEGEVTLSNTYSGIDFARHAGGGDGGGNSGRPWGSDGSATEDSRWWKCGFHNHGPNGEEQLGFFPYQKVAKLLSDAGYRAACIVEHEQFVKYKETEARQLEKV
jgi:hypothetical protein